MLIYLPLYYTSHPQNQNSMPLLFGILGYFGTTYDDAVKTTRQVWFLRLFPTLRLKSRLPPVSQKLASKAGHQLLQHFQMAFWNRLAKLFLFFSQFFFPFFVTLDQCWRDSNEQCQNNDILWSWQEIVQSCDSQVGHILCLSKMRQLNWKIA